MAIIRNVYDDLRDVVAQYEGVRPGLPRLEIAEIDAVISSFSV